MLLTFGQMTRHQGHFLIYEDDANFARLSKDQDCEGKFIIVRRAVGPGGVPCCVFLALSWNTNETNENPSADKGRVRIIKMEIQDGICHEGGGLDEVSSATYLF